MLAYATLRTTRMGRTAFTASEIDEIRRLLREKVRANRDRQKSIRARLRRIGFRVSELGGGPGFDEGDLEALIQRGAIAILNDDEPPKAGLPSTSGPAVTTVVEDSEGDAESDTGELTTTVELAQEAFRLQIPLEDARDQVPSKPGLYAIFGSRVVWGELGLGDAPDEKPLYIGKAEDSLASRDLKTHFSDGRTGQSTLRRSFAALLRESLGLQGRPRNPQKPERFANYGLSAEHDERLTAWMRRSLAIATWPKPTDCTFALLEIEVALLNRLKPPLNLRDVVTPWTNYVKEARAAMAKQAGRWRPET
jgi:GIY-YIG catalytic domain